jgi:hypothetical protein
MKGKHSFLISLILFLKSQLQNMLIFKIGGKHKKQNQIKNAEKGYIVKDDIAYGIDNIIPLWCFGFIY